MAGDFRGGLTYLQAQKGADLEALKTKESSDWSIIYVIADIHGEFFKFKKMLDLINFSDEDTLYILGDVVDRGKYPIRTLLYIMEYSNMRMLLGNHEIMMLNSSFDKYYGCWMNNGGEVTLNQYCELSIDNRSKIEKYLRLLPSIMELDKYILVHAGYTKEIHDLDFCLWAREDFLDRETGIDKTVIFGHTPTYFMTREKPMSIWYGDGRIGIDCGACFDGGRLGCLRLDDMQEFYV